MPKKITVDIPSQYKSDVLNALKVSKRLIDKRAEKIWADYTSRSDFHLWDTPPEHKELTHHSGILGPVIGGIEKEIENEKNRKYQAKRRKEKNDN